MSFWRSVVVAASSACVGARQCLCGRRAYPAGRATPRSWPWIACTCGTVREPARRRNASHATSGRGRATEPAPPAGCYAGTCDTGARPRHPSP